MTATQREISISILSRIYQKKCERATCQIVPFDKGSSTVSRGDHGSVKDFLSDCFFSTTTLFSCLRRALLVVFIAVYHTVAQMDVIY